MQKLSDGRVYLEEGEVVPVMCVCGHMWKPDEDDTSIGLSQCGMCGRLSELDKQSFVLEPMRVND